MLLSLVAAATLLPQAQASPPANPDAAKKEAEAFELFLKKWQEEHKQTLDPKHLAELKRDAEMGREYSAQVEKELKLSKDQELIDRLQRVADNVVRVANASAAKALWGDGRLNPFDYRFKVVEGKDINAFSLPGGYIYVYEGLLKYVESDDELAGVLAHEVSHAGFRHLATLLKEQSRFDLWSLPLVLVSLLSGSDAGGHVLLAKDLVNQVGRSGWSQKAEHAADFGAFQYLRGTSYNPVGLLTFMERLARDQRGLEAIDWGIFRTHPPSRDRADVLTAYLGEAEIPIRRSEVSTSFRAIAKPVESGGVEIVFNGRKIVRLAGNDAAERAESAIGELNAFFDQVPELFEVQVQPGGAVVGRKKTLFRITEADAGAEKTTLEELAQETQRALKRSLFMLGYRVWDTR